MSIFRGVDVPGVMKWFVSGWIVLSISQHHPSIASSEPSWVNGYSTCSLAHGSSKKLMTGTSLVIGVLDFGKIIWTKDTRIMENCLQTSIFPNTLCFFCKSFFFGCAVNIPFASLFFFVGFQVGFYRAIVLFTKDGNPPRPRNLLGDICCSSCKLQLKLPVVGLVPNLPKEVNTIIWGEIPRETFPLNRWSLTFKKTSAWALQSIFAEEFPKQQLKHIQVGWVLFSPRVDGGAYFFSLKAQWSTSIYEGRVKPPKTSGPPNFQQKQKQGRINLGSRFKYMGRYTSWATDNLPHRVQWKSHWTWVDRSKSRNQKPTVRERLASVFWKAFGEELGETTRKTLKNGWNMGGNESILEEFFKVSVVSPVPKPTGLVYGYLGTNPPTQDAIVDPHQYYEPFSGSGNPEVKLHFWRLHPGSGVDRIILVLAGRYLVHF